MSALVLDAGALVAIDRNDRDVHRTVRDAHRMGVQVLTNSVAVAQVWRDSKGRILTSDPGDLRTLCEAAGNRVQVVRC